MSADADTATESTPTKISPGLFTEIFVGVLWLATSAWTARASYVGDGLDLDGALGDAIGSLPSTVAATIFTSATIASAVAGRFPRLRTRILVGLGAGAAFGALAAAGVRFGYGSGSAVGILAVVVGAAGLVGGAAVALPGPVLEGVLWATTWVLFFGLIFGVMSTQLTSLFGGGPGASDAAQQAAQGRAAVAQSVATGVIGSLHATSVLRRERPAWGWYPIACAAPGLVLLAAEGLTRLGGSALADVLPGGSALVNLDAAARLRHGLTVLVVGTLLGIFLARRSQPAYD